MRSRASTATPSPLTIGYDDIRKVQAYPVPEGSPPPPLVRSASSPLNGKPLSMVRGDIPSPFPAPQMCTYAGWGDGLKLSVWLVDGRRLNYFDCAFPDELKELYDDAWR
jgi:hypothetical protein